MPRGTCTGIHFVNYPPSMELLVWIRQVVNLVTLVCKDPVVVSLELLVMIDFHHAILVLTNPSLGFEPIVNKEE